MADNSDWSAVPSGAVPLQAQYSANDQAIRQKYPNWPVGGTAAQIGIESNGNNNAVSPKGATGIAQMMPDTFDAISKQLGRKLDIHNVNDQMIAHRYLMLQNLDRTGGDTDGALSLYNSGRATPDNPETTNYVNKFNQKTQPTSDEGWSNSSAPPGWAPSGPPPKTPENNNSIMENIKGAGLQALNLGAGALETPAILGAAAIGGVDRALGGTPLAENLEKTMSNVGKNYQMLSPENALNKMGVDTSGVQKTTGYQVPSEVMNYLGETLPGQLAAAGTPGSPFAAAQTLSPEQQRAAKPALQLAELAAPMLHIPGVKEGAPGGAIGKLAPDDAAAPSAIKPSEFVGPQQEGMGPLQDQPNAGVPRGPISVDTEGVAYPAESGVNPDDVGISAARENPNSGPQIEPDVLQSRLDAMRDAPAEQLDMFNDIGQRTFDQFGPDETPRHLNQDEFAETVQNLAEKDGTRFPLPEDMDHAYEQYLNTVRDDQGGLFDRATIAKNFVDASVKEALDRRVNDHPTVVANQAKVDSLTSQIAADAANGSHTTALEAARDRAQRTLEQSKENIGRYFKSVEEVGAPKVGPDGVVHMYTFGHLPTLMKSIGAILKGLHGVVFKTLDRVLPNFKNLDSGPKIMAQGMKNFINREATRDWSQTVNAKPIEQLGKIPGLRDAVTELNPHAQEDLSPEQLKQQFNQAPDLSDSKVGNFLRNNVLQGGLMLSDFSRHPLVKFTTDSVAKAFRAADKWNRENLLNAKTGLAPMIKRMSTQEFTEMRSLMEAYEGVKEFTANELKGRGFSDKQIEYYQRSLELQKDAFNKFNAGRQLAGLPPISPRIAHIAGYFTGDFKQIVKDSAGRVVAVLGHNNRAALATVAKRFQELHPDGANLDMGKPTLNKNVAAGDNTFNGFMNILNEMSKTNADVERLVQAYHDTQMAATNKLSQMANRAKFKSNPESRVGGAEGQKLWQSMEKNAQDGGKQQLKYLESLNRWSEFQQAIKKSEDFIKDPEVNAPNAKAVSQVYLDNQMHRNLGELNKFTNSLSNGVADITGVGPTQMRQIANLTKTGLLNMFVGLGKFSHSLVTLLQPLFGIPEVNSVLSSRGAKLGISQATSLFKSMMDNKEILQSMATGGSIKDPFVRAATQYAKDNDTFNTSQFNMGSVTHPASKLGNALHINVTVPESGTRAFTYMYYARMLKDVAGDTMSDKEIFGTAHNAVQKVMADYNREAAAPMFNKMGFLGDLTRMLTTFKMNQISQAATATKMFKQGQFGPMATMLATSVAASGLRGFIGYNIANTAIGQITTWATKQGLMSQPTNLDQMVLHMLHGVNKNLADALNFGATSGLGIDMTGSLSHADDIPDDPIGTLLPEGEPIGKMLGSSLTALEHPNKQNAKAALYDALPNSMKGIMENQAYTDEKGNYYDPHTGNLVSNRSPGDQMKRNFSFRPLEESKMRLQAEVDKGHEQQLGAVKSEIVKRALSDADSKSLTPQSMQQYAQEYVKAGGDPNELVSSLTTHLGINKNLNIQQREQGMAKGFTGAEHYQRAQEYK